MHGEQITQQQLADYLNRVFGTKLKYREMSVAEYREERIAVLGDFLGSVIAASMKASATVQQTTKARLLSRPAAITKVGRIISMGCGNRISVFKR